MNTSTTYNGTPTLVTGASGFIGSCLCGQLSKQDNEIVGTYLNNAPNERNVKAVCLDLTDLNRVRELIQEIRPELIFHLAGSPQGSRELDAVVPTYMSNLTSTVNVLIAAQEAGCCKRMVIANSQEEPRSIDSEVVPVSPYAASKISASAYARMFNTLYNFPVVIARIFMVYGPGQKDYSKLVPYTILQALDGKIPELSSGSRKIDWVYVNDVVEGLLQLGKKSGIEGETIDLGSGKYYTIKETVNEILEQVDPSLEARFGALEDRKLEREPIAKVEDTLARVGWQAHVSLKDGLARTIAWYREQQNH